MTNQIPFTIPQFSEPEISAVNDLLTSPEHILTEKYTKLSRSWLSDYYQKEVLLTHSCTAALEMSALLLDLKPGDEVILPSFTFVSTANAFVLYGAKPVFVDSDPITLNIDPVAVAAAITSRTKAIVVMHYAGIGCDMDVLQTIAQQHNVHLIEDAAQCLGARYHQQALGTFGSLGTLSFHNTKNITAGLGGALIVNDAALLARAKILWQKGTNREAFIEGQVDKYTWQDLGSSFMINELGAALLFGQLNRLAEITQTRLSIWQRYHEGLADFEQRYHFRRPVVPPHTEHNGHIYYLLAPDDDSAASLRRFLCARGITATSHYVPLHLAPAALRFNAVAKRLPVCEIFYKRIIRLPLWEGMANHVDHVLEAITDWHK